MPRKAKADIIKYVADPVALVNNAINRRHQVQTEFMNDLRNAPLLRLKYPDGGHYYNYVFAMTKHFPVCLMYFYDDNANDAWPSRFLYGAPEANDIVHVSFCRFCNMVSIREMELIDISFTIIASGPADTIPFFDSVENFYYDRKNRIFTGFNFSTNLIPQELALTDIYQYVYEFDDNYSSTLGNLFNFWYRVKIYFEGNQEYIDSMNQLIVPESSVSMIDPAPIQISNHNIAEFTVYDKRDERFLKYDVNGNIIGTDKSESWLKQAEIALYYDISLTNLNDIIYVVQVDQLAIFTQGKIAGNLVKLMSTLENWLKYKKVLPVGGYNQGTPEWFPGNFPKTEFNHMVFYGGHSFYIPDSYVIDANLTRLTKDAGYLTTKFITDVFNVNLLFIPMRNTVSYGKWTEYMEPNQSQLVQILRTQWWSLSSKWGDARVATSKEGVIEVGRKGTKIAGVIPGLNSILSLITTGGSLM